MKKYILTVFLITNISNSFSMCNLWSNFCCTRDKSPKKEKIPKIIKKTDEQYAETGTERKSIGPRTESIEKYLYLVPSLKIVPSNQKSLKK